ncbi:hypothetical protein BC835DRAFT_302945 [Cytidiella melzeri]|nr:hypothetical protein BC835DRAFT_302945 [Cytidiella melzeri]
MENLDSSSTQLTDTGHLSWTAPGSRQGDESTDEKGWKEWKEWKEYWNERKKRKEWEEWRQWKDGKGDSDSLPCVEPVRVVKEQERRPDNLSQVHDADELRTQYVLSGQPTGWSAMAKLIREYDEDKVRDCKEDIDTLLVFAGLFSAVLTAFLLESYQNLSEDTAKESLGAQRQLVLQTSSYELKGNFLNSTAAPLTPSTPFQPSPVDVCVNVLWFASLLFALTTASFGILVKQWLREYLAVQNPSPQARLRLRHLRHPELGKWKIFEIAAILPLLLQLSLALFFVGLCYFTASVHRSIGYTTLPLVAVWALCFTTVTILPLFFPRCPYRTTLLKSLIGPLHRFVGQLASGATTWSIEKAQHSAESTFKMRERLWWQMSRVSSRAAQKCQAADETRVVDIVEEDLEILADADGIQCDDELLSTTISGAAGQVFSRDKDPDKMFEFIRHILANRLQLSPDAEVLPALVVNLRNTALSLRAQNAIMDVVSRFYQEQQLDQLQWLSTAYSESTFIFALMLSASGRHVLEVPRTAPQLVLHQMTEHIGVYCCRLVLASSRSRVIEAESTVLNILDGLASLRTSFYMGYEPLHVLEWILQAWRTKVNPRCRLQNASAELCFVEDVVARTLNSTESWPWEIMSTSLQCSVVNFLLRHLEQDVEGPADSITAGTDLGTHGSLKPVNAVVLEFLLVLFYTLRHRAHRNAGRITVPSAGRIGESKNTFMLELMGADAWRAMLSRVLGTSVYLANTFALAVAFVPSDVVLYLAYHLTTVTIDEDSEPVPGTNPLHEALVQR